MSDEDTDWESDEGGDTANAGPNLAPPPVPRPAAPVVVKALPPAFIEAESLPLPAQQVFLATPVQLTPPVAKVQVCGATVLYTAADNSWKLFFYDNNSQPTFSELITADCEKGKQKKGFNAPSMFEMLDGPLATMVDERRRGWKIQFQDRSQSLRMLIFICIAQAATRAQQNLPPYSLVDIAKGLDKPCKPKHLVEANIRCWRVQMNAQDGTLTQPIPPHLASFNPSFADTSSIFATSVQVAADEPPDAELPTKLGQVVGRMCSEGQRVLVCPASSPLGRALVADYLTEPSHRAIACKEGYFLVLFVQVTGISKAKKDKEKKAKKEKVARIVYKEETKAEDSTKKEAAKGRERGESVATVTASSILPIVTPPPQAIKTDDVMALAPSAAAAKPARAPLFSMDDSAASVSAASAASSSSSSFSAAETSPTFSPSPPNSSSSFSSAEQQLDQCVRSLQTVQSKLLKALINKGFEAIVRDLYLNSTTSPSIIPGGDDVEDTEDVTARKKVTKTIVKQHVVQILGQYDQANNTSLDTGTLRSVVQAFQQFEKQQPKQDPKLAKLVTDLQAQVKQLEAEKKAQADAQLKLGTEYLTLEEKVSAMRKENEELKKKCQMTEVFEQGMKDMRKILSDETAEKNKLQGELTDLLQLQRGLKMTWLPDKYATNCMLCKEKFKTFGGKSKGHCRYCGRLFCQDCCTTSEIPEYGFREKVKICRSCFDFRRKAGGDGGGDDKEA